MLFDDKTKGIAQAYLSMLGESHFKVGDKVKCKASGMNGTVTKLDKEDGGENEKYYTVKQDSGKVMKYAPNELSKLNEAMDPVNPKAVKKKFDDRMDKDIDNDGDVDDSDEYLHKRRKAISKAVKKEAIEIEMQKKSKMNGSDDDDDDDEDMVAKGNDKMKVKKNSKKDDEESMKESKDMMKVAKEIEAYAKKSGGVDKNDMMKVASMVKRGQVKQAIDFAKDLDSDPRDYILGKMGMMEGVEELDELSKKTMGSYVKKASDDRMWSGVKAADNSRSSSTQDAASRRATKRKQGIAKATDRLTKEDYTWDWDAILEAPEEEIDAMIEEMSDDDLESFVSEFEQLDEVSTGTLARAANAAADPDADVRYGMKGHDPQKFADYAKRKKGSKAAAAVQGAADGKGYSRPGRSTGMDKMRFRQNRSTDPNMVTKSGKLTKTSQKGLKSQMKEGSNWYQASTNSVQPMRPDGRETLDPRAEADRAFANAHRQDVNIKDYPGKDKPVTNAKPQAPVRPGEKRNPEPRKTLSDIRNKMK